jgi:cytochrome P450
VSLTRWHSCLGWRFSIAEMQVVLAHLLATFDLAPLRPGMKLSLYVPCHVCRAVTDV